MTAGPPASAAAGGDASPHPLLARAGTRWWNSDCAIGLAILLALALLAAPEFPKWNADSVAYLAMARGHGAEVVLPYASRILLPALARALSRIPGVDLDLAFALVSIAALVAWTAAIVHVARASALAPGYAALALLVSPPVLMAFEAATIPDMLTMACVAAILWLLRRRWPLAAALVLAVSILARETFLVLAAIAAALSLARRDVRTALPILVGGALGFAAMTHFTAGHANIHDMPSFVYVLLKVPIRFVMNVLGVGIWTDAFKWCQAPVLTVGVPAWLDLGRTHRVGLCAFDPGLPLFVLSSVATLFGILPAVLTALLAGRFRAVLSRLEGWCLIAFWYGALMTLLGTMVGASIDRLVSYGWPLFLLALAALADAAPDWPKRLVAWLVVLNLAVYWLPYYVVLYTGALAERLGLDYYAATHVTYAFSALVGGVGNVLAYRLVRPHRMALLPARPSTPSFAGPNDATSERG